MGYILKKMQDLGKTNFNALIKGKGRKTNQFIKLYNRSLAKRVKL